jgi:hypothetical protein
MFDYLLHNIPYWVKSIFTCSLLIVVNYVLVCSKAIHMIEIGNNYFPNAILTQRFQQSL